MVTTERSAAPVALISNCGFGTAIRRRSDHVSPARGRAALPSQLGSVVFREDGP
jgi:hypothetical protein